MNDLVFKGANNQALTNSLLVAEKFDKNHSDVVRSIDNLLEKTYDADFQCDAKMRAHKMFSSYMEDVPQPNGGMKPAKRYVMNRDGFTLLAMGFTGTKAFQFKIDYISAFNQMEETIKSGGFQVPSSFREALLLAAKQQEKIEQQQLLLTEQAPKVLFADSVQTSQRSCLIAELAKILHQNGVNVGQNRLFLWMRENGYLCSKGDYYNQPTQKAMEMELFEMKKSTINKPNGSVLVTTTTKVTGKGQIYFVSKFLSKTPHLV